MGSRMLQRRSGATKTFHIDLGLGPTARPFQLLSALGVDFNLNDFRSNFSF